MEVQALVNEDNTETALHFPDPMSGYMITMTTDQIEQLIGI